VNAASKHDVLDSRSPANGKGLHVMEFEKGRLIAAPLCADECALPVIPFPDRAPHMGWNVARPTDGRPRLRLTRVRGLGKSATFQVLDKQRQRTVENIGLVPEWQRVTQQPLRSSEFVVRRTRDRETEPVAIAIERDCPGRWPRHF
jgi:hypothetical protein